MEHIAGRRVRQENLVALFEDKFQNMETRMVCCDEGGRGDRVGIWLSGWRSAMKLTLKTQMKVTMEGKSRGEVRSEIG